MTSEEEDREEKFVDCESSSIGTVAEWIQKAKIRDEKIWAVSRTFQPTIETKTQELLSRTMWFRISYFWITFLSLITWRNLKRVELERWNRIVQHKKILTTMFIEAAKERDSQSFTGTSEQCDNESKTRAVMRMRPVWVARFIRVFGFRYRVVLISGFTLICLIYQIAVFPESWLMVFLVTPFIWNSFLIAVYEGRGFKPKVLTNEEYAKQEYDWCEREKFEDVLRNVSLKSDK